MAKLNRSTVIKAVGAGLLVAGVVASVAVANYGGGNVPVPLANYRGGNDPVPLARYRWIPLEHDPAGGKLLDNGDEIFGPWLDFGLDRNGATIQKRTGLALIQQFDAQIAVDPETGRDVKVWGEVLLTETSQTLPGGSGVRFWTVGFTPNTKRMED